MSVRLEIKAAADSARADFESMSPHECQRTADFIRASLPLLGSERQREMAEQMACEYEQQVASRAGRRPTS